MMDKKTDKRITLISIAIVTVLTLFFMKACSDFKKIDFIGEKDRHYDKDLYSDEELNRMSFDEFIYAFSTEKSVRKRSIYRTTTLISDNDTTFVENDSPDIQQLKFGIEFSTLLSFDSIFDPNLTFYKKRSDSLVKIETFNPTQNKITNYTFEKEQRWMLVQITRRTPTD